MKKFFKALKEKFWAIIWAALKKVSKVNWTMYSGMILMLIQTYLDKSIISTAVFLVLTGLFGFLFKVLDSTKQLVETGVNINWSVHFLTLGMVALGVIDQWVLTGYDVVDIISFGHPTLFLFVYWTITVIFRTGFTNQSLNSVAKNK